MPDINNSSKMALDKIMSVPADQITKSFIEDMFASYHDKETNTFKQANFNPTDKIELTHKDYIYVKDKVLTSIGMLIFNRYVLERTGFIKYTGYWNTVIDNKGLSELILTINEIVIDGKMTTKDLGAFTDSRDKIGFWCSAFLAASITDGLIRPMDNVNKRKAELFKEYESSINSDNPVDQIMTVNKIEKELLDMVRENLKSDSGYDMYASGVNNLDNNYKTINVMRGAVFNNATKKYDIVENSLMNGVTKKDISAFANSVVAGAYPSAVGTAEAGYMSKILLALLQSEHIDANPKSDCGTLSTIPITITKKNKQYLLYRNININGKMVQTTPDVINNYIGKTVQMYSPQCCKNDAICAKCAGQAFYKLEVTQIGLLTSQITKKILDLKLKSKHNLSQSAGIISKDQIFADQNNYFSIDDGTLHAKTTMKLFIPRVLEEISGFSREATSVDCMGIFPVKFYDKNNTELLSTMMTVPALLTFNVYSDIQEDADNYIITYEPDSDVCRLVIQKSIINVEFFINQIYFYSRTAQLPYNSLTNYMFKCLELNSIDLTGVSLIYELLARRMCRNGIDTFAKAYGKNSNIDQMSYQKQSFREAVQDAGVLQGILFQDTSKSIVKGLSQTLNGVKPTETPLEKIIKS